MALGRAQLRRPGRAPSGERRPTLADAGPSVDWCGRRSSRRTRPPWRMRDSHGDRVWRRSAHGGRYARTRPSASDHPYRAHVATPLRREAPAASRRAPARAQLGQCRIQKIRIRFCSYRTSRRGPRREQGHRVDLSLAEPVEEAPDLVVRRLEDIPHVLPAPRTSWLKSRSVVGFSTNVFDSCWIERMPTRNRALPPTLAWTSGSC